MALDILAVKRSHADNITTCQQVKVKRKAPSNVHLELFTSAKALTILEQMRRSGRLTTPWIIALLSTAHLAQHGSRFLSST